LLTTSNAHWKLYLLSLFQPFPFFSNIL
jgi:hypothetical protein